MKINNITNFDEKQQNIIRGKNLVKKASPEDVDFLLSQLLALEHWLDVEECDDKFGTKGWQYAFELYLRDEG